MSGGGSQVRRRPPDRIGELPIIIPRRGENEEELLRQLQEGFDQVSREAAALQRYGHGLRITPPSESVGFQEDMAQLETTLHNMDLANVPIFGERFAEVERAITERIANAREAYVAGRLGEAETEANSALVALGRITRAFEIAMSLAMEPEPTIRINDLTGAELRDMLINAVGRAILDSDERRAAFVLGVIEEYASHRWIYDDENVVPVTRVLLGRALQRSEDAVQSTEYADVDQDEEFLETYVEQRETLEERLRETNIEIYNDWIAHLTNTITAEEIAGRSTQQLWELVGELEEIRSELLEGREINQERAERTAQLYFQLTGQQMPLTEEQRSEVLEDNVSQAARRGRVSVGTPEWFGQQAQHALQQGNEARAALANAMAIFMQDAELNRQHGTRTPAARIAREYLRDYQIILEVVTGRREADSYMLGQLSDEIRRAGLNLRIDGLEHRYRNERGGRGTQEQRTRVNRFISRIREALDAGDIRHAETLARRLARYVDVLEQNSDAPGLAEMTRSLDITISGNIEAESPELLFTRGDNLYEISLRTSELRQEVVREWRGLDPQLETATQTLDRIDELARNGNVREARRAIGLFLMYYDSVSRLRQRTGRSRNYSLAQANIARLAGMESVLGRILQGQTISEDVFMQSFNDAQGEYLSQETHRIQGRISELHIRNGVITQAMQEVEARRNRNDYGGAGRLLQLVDEYCNRYVATSGEGRGYAQARRRMLEGIGTAIVASSDRTYRSAAEQFDQGTAIFARAQELENEARYFREAYFGSRHVLIQGERAGVIPVGTGEGREGTTIRINEIIGYEQEQRRQGRISAIRPSLAQLMDGVDAAVIRGDVREFDEARRAYLDRLGTLAEQVAAIRRDENIARGFDDAIGVLDGIYLAYTRPVQQPPTPSTPTARARGRTGRRLGPSEEPPQAEVRTWNVPEPMYRRYETLRTRLARLNGEHMRLRRRGSNATARELAEFQSDYTQLMLQVDVERRSVAAYQLVGDEMATTRGYQGAVGHERSSNARDANGHLQRSLEELQLARYALMEGRPFTDVAQHYERAMVFRANAMRLYRADSAGAYYGSPERNAVAPRTRERELQCPPEYTTYLRGQMGVFDTLVYGHGVERDALQGVARGLSAVEQSIFSVNTQNREGFPGTRFAQRQSDVLGIVDEAIDASTGGVVMRQRTATPRSHERGARLELITAGDPRLIQQAERLVAEIPQMAEQVDTVRHVVLAWEGIILSLVPGVGPALGMAWFIGLTSAQMIDEIRTTGSASPATIAMFVGTIALAAFTGTAMVLRSLSARTVSELSAARRAGTITPTRLAQQWRTVRHYRQMGTLAEGSTRVVGYGFMGMIGVDAIDAARERDYGRMFNSIAMLAVPVLAHHALATPRARGARVRPSRVEQTERFEQAIEILEQEAVAPREEVRSVEDIVVRPRSSHADVQRGIQDANALLRPGALEQLMIDLNRDPASSTEARDAYQNGQQILARLRAVDRARNVPEGQGIADLVEGLAQNGRLRNMLATNPNDYSVTVFADAGRSMIEEGLRVRGDLAPRPGAQVEEGLAAPRDDIVHGQRPSEAEEARAGVAVDANGQPVEAWGGRRPAQPRGSSGTEEYHTAGETNVPPGARSPADAAAERPDAVGAARRGLEARGGLRGRARAAVDAALGELRGGRNAEPPAQQNQPPIENTVTRRVRERLVAQTNARGRIVQANAESLAQTLIALDARMTQLGPNARAGQVGNTLIDLYARINANPELMRALNEIAAENPAFRRVLDSASSYVDAAIADARGMQGMTREVFLTQRARAPSSELNASAVMEAIASGQGDALGVIAERFGIRISPRDGAQALLDLDAGGAFGEHGPRVLEGQQHASSGQILSEVEGVYAETNSLIPGVARNARIPESQEIVEGVLGAFAQRVRDSATNGGNLDTILIDALRLNDNPVIEAINNSYRTVEVNGRQINAGELFARAVSESSASTIEGRIADGTRVLDSLDIGVRLRNAGTRSNNQVLEAIGNELIGRIASGETGMPGQLTREMLIDVLQSPSVRDAVGTTFGRPESTGYNAALEVYDAAIRLEQATANEGRSTTVEQVIGRFERLRTTLETVGAIQGRGPIADQVRAGMRRRILEGAELNEDLLLRVLREDVTGSSAAAEYLNRLRTSMETGTRGLQEILIGVESSGRIHINRRIMPPSELVLIIESAQTRIRNYNTPPAPVRPQAGVAVPPEQISGEPTPQLHLERIQVTRPPDLRRRPSRGPSRLEAHRGNDQRAAAEIPEIELGDSSIEFALRELGTETDPHFGRIYGRSGVLGDALSIFARGLRENPMVREGFEANGILHEAADRRANELHDRAGMIAAQDEPGANWANRQWRRTEGTRRWMNRWLLMGYARPGIRGQGEWRQAWGIRRPGTEIFPLRCRRARTIWRLVVLVQLTAYSAGIWGTPWVGINALRDENDVNRATLQMLQLFGGMIQDRSNARFLVEDESVGFRRTLGTTFGSFDRDEPHATGNAPTAPGQLRAVNSDQLRQQMRADEAQSETIRAARLEDLLEESRALSGHLDEINRALASGDDAALTLALNHEDIRDLGFTPEHVRAVMDGLPAVRQTTGFIREDIIPLLRDHWRDENIIYGGRRAIVEEFLLDAGIITVDQALTGQFSGQLGRRVENMIDFFSDPAHEDAFVFIWENARNGHLPLADLRGVMIRVAANYTGWERWVDRDLQAAATREAASAENAQPVEEGASQPASGTPQPVAPADITPEQRRAAIEARMQTQLQRVHLYRTEPYPENSFFAIMEQRMTMAPEVREAFQRTINQYRSDESAMALFNGFVIGPQEMIYGDPNRLAAGIVEIDRLTRIAQNTGANAQERATATDRLRELGALTTQNGTDHYLTTIEWARATGYVGNSILGELDPRLLRIEENENAPDNPITLVSFVNSHSESIIEGQTGTNAGTAISTGIYAWIQRQEGSILALSEILVILSSDNGILQHNASEIYHTVRQGRNPVEQGIITQFYSQFREQELWIGAENGILPSGSITEERRQRLRRFVRENIQHGDESWVDGALDTVGDSAEWLLNGYAMVVSAGWQREANIPEGPTGAQYRQRQANIWERLRQYPIRVTRENFQPTNPQAQQPETQAPAPQVITTLPTAVRQFYTAHGEFGELVAGPIGDAVARAVEQGYIPNTSQARAILTAQLQMELYEAVTGQDIPERRGTGPGQLPPRERTTRDRRDRDEIERDRRVMQGFGIEYQPRTEENTSTLALPDTSMRTMAMQALTGYLNGLVDRRNRGAFIRAWVGTDNAR